MSVPAEVDQYGVQRWLKNGEPHRLDLPAVIYADSSCEWCRDGREHRDDGPASMMSYMMSVGLAWRVRGKLHREDGPAIVDPGYVRWRMNDKAVRLPKTNQ